METPSWHTARDLVDMNFPHTNYKNETTLATVLNFFSTFKYIEKVIYIHCKSLHSLELNSLNL